MWLLFTPAPFLIAGIAQAVGAPLSRATILVTTVLLAMLFLLPMVRSWGLRVAYANWNRVGLIVAVGYLLAAALAHNVALGRMQRFAEQEHLQVDAIGALPLPPSLWRWDGLIRAPRGVYEMRMNLGEGLFHKTTSTAGSSDLDAMEHTYYPDAFANPWIEQAQHLPEVQKVLWFARFPVTVFRKEGDEAVVEFSDLRFPHMRPDRPSSFTYRVRFSADGKVIMQGWVRR